MTELKYEKQITTKLNNIIYNDSLVISSLQQNLNDCVEQSKIKAKKLRKERNIFITSTVVAALLSLLVLIK